MKSDRKTKIDRYRVTIHGITEYPIRVKTTEVRIDPKYRKASLKKNYRN